MQDDRVEHRQPREERREPSATGGASLLRRAAGWLARRRTLPATVRAVFGYYADSGVFDASSLRIKLHVDDAVDAIVADAFDRIESAIEAELDVEDPSFGYGTKLTLPAELTLGYLYRQAVDVAPPGYDPVTDSTGGLFATLRGRRVDPDSPDAREAREMVERATETTALVVEALLDGDLRDAINDEEYEDLDVGLPADDARRRRVAEIAQRELQASLEPRFEEFPDAVRAVYDRAVDLSEAHQDRDGYFRALMADADDGDVDARERVREEYKHARADALIGTFDEDDLTVPYFKTQYGRVGVIYDGMVEMYRAAGFDVDENFRTAIVLSIIGAQIWLDDVDDFEADMAEGQLTPVTAEYLLADDPADAYEEIVAVTTRYLETARWYAMRSDTPLVGIAIEYILRTGTPDGLPGAEG